MGGSSPEVAGASAGGRTASGRDHRCCTDADPASMKQRLIIGYRSRTCRSTLLIAAAASAVSVPVSKSRSMVSIAELPVIPATVNFVMAIAMLAPMAP